MSILETTRLAKRFGRQLAVDHISITVEAGQIFGFLGPNGSGKTTTIGLLLGILTPTDGSFRLLGEHTRAGLNEARRRVGATLETPNFYPYLSGRDNLRIAANIKRVPHTRIPEVLEIVGLASRAKDRFGAYSLGMKQRLALAATMLGNPELVILDEPANGLDPEGMREIREIILQLREQGKTIFVSSHLLWEVERTCTHVAIISKGRIVQQASVRDIVAGTVLASVRCADLRALQLAASEYSDTVTASIEGDSVILELKNDDLASLNQFLAGRGMYVSHLTIRHRTLEEVFMELTGSETAPPIAT